MKLPSILSNLFGSKVTLKNKFNEAFLYGFGGYTQYDDKAPTYLEKGYNYNPIVYAIINQQSIKTASIPYYVKKVDDKQAHKRLKRLRMATKGDYSVQQQVRSMILENKAFSEADMPFPLEAPNISQTWTEFLSLYKCFLKLTGNVYIYLLAPEDGMNKGTPIQVYLLPSHLVQIVTRNKADMMGVESPVSGYILTYGRSYIKFDASNVIHIKYSNPNYDESGSHLYGQSPLRSALRNILSSNKALDLNIKTIKSGGAFGFIHGKQTAITEDQAKSIKERLLEMNSSPEDLSKIAGISAEIGFTRLSLTSDELKPFDYLNFDQKQIANVLGWDDKLLNSDAGAKYDNIAHARKRVITDNIQPDLLMFADAINTEFLPRFKGYEGTVLEFDFMELPEMQTDTTELVTWLKEALDRGVITRNEFRLAISYVVVEDDNMDKHTVSTDIMSLDEALETQFNI